MGRLENKIIEMIRQQGPISFEQFMEMALYDPNYGYYSSQATPVGREGDFYTSSHLHSVFGVMIAKQVEEMWELMERPRDFSVLEIGAGAGYVCLDMFGYFREREIFESLKYLIVERNPVLMNKQKALLDEFSGRIRWFPYIDEISPFTGCVFTNELLDAFPVHLVQMEDELKEIFLNHDGKVFKEVLKPLSSSKLKEYFEEFSLRIEKGYRTEVNLRIRGWLRKISTALKEGFVLTIDYGFPAYLYYSEDRNRGTLICYYGHQFNENPYLHIGEQDITAHVNFSSLKAWGEENGLKSVGFCTQGTFLVSLGIDKEIERISRTSRDYLFELAKIKKLILPGGMGDSHKVLAQYKGDKILKLKGFSMRNQVGSLD